MQPTNLAYIPHGINSKSFFPIEDANDPIWQTIRQKLFGNDDIRFAVLYNSRNIRRKMTSDVILAYREFLLTLPVEERKYCRLVMHTQPVDENGTDLYAVLRDCAPEVKVAWSADRLDIPQMNAVYNLCSVTINMSSNEGWGLGITESMMAGTMVIANVTGGLQDQMGFTDDSGQYLHEDVHYNVEWGSNADGRYRSHGEWCIPVFPANRALIGSPPTPYIFDDRCNYQDAAKAIRQVYDLGPVERKRRGLLGRQYVLTQGMNADEMSRRFISGIETVLANWTPREKYTLIRA